MRTVLIGMILAAATVSQGCAPVVVGGAATGVAVAHDRRTTGSVIEDQAIELKSYEALSNDRELKEQGHINVTSYNGIVLVSGEVPTEAMRTRAGQIVRDIEKVRDVHNELAIAAPSSTLSRSSDAVITTKVKALMFAEKNFDPTRAKVVTERGTVYLMGLVTRREADIATEITRGVSGVQRVVKLFEYLD